MSSSTVNTLLVIGAVAAGIGAIIYRCQAEFLAPLCKLWPEGSNPLDTVISEFNKLPTLVQNPSTNEYRSVRMDKEDPKVVSKRIQDQSDFSNPTTKKAADTYIKVANNNAGKTSSKGYDPNSTLCKTYPNICTGRYSESKYARSSLAMSLHGYRMSVN